MKVTVCIPTYRRPVLLKKAILSLKSESKLIDEIMILDNNSGDETEAVIKKLKITFPQINYIKHKENIGYCKNIEYSLRHLTNDILIYLSDDDSFKKGIIKRYIDIFKEYSNVGVVGSNLLQIKNNKVDYKVKNYPHTELISNKLDKLNSLHGLIILTAIGFRKYPFMRNLKLQSKIFPQIEAGMRILRTKDLYTLDEYYTNFLVHSNNMIKHYINAKDINSILDKDLIFDVKKLYITEKIHVTGQNTKGLINYWLRSFDSAFIERIGRLDSFRIIIKVIASYPFIVINPLFYVFVAPQFILPRALINRTKLIFKKISNKFT